MLSTKSGWRIVRKYKQFQSPWRRSIQNWSIQSAGADLLRLICCRATERGIRVLAPIHDALVVEDSIEDIDRTVTETREIMTQASIDMFGLPIRTEAKIFHDRFIDDRGVTMWNRINEMMNEIGTDYERRDDQMELFGGVRGVHT